ncbi:MAG: glycosyltransferase family 4 protein [Verrucomicrobia bacterium]|nr:glycosyltransferase family 4 protein [Verrucomicrobiota bacterium]
MSSKTSTIAVLGHFADGSDRVDGQILRTRIARDELSRRLGADRVVWADTGFLKQHPIRSLLNISKALKQADTLVILPGPRGLSLLLPWYLRWKRKTGGAIHYLVIGGWLPRHLQNIPGEINRVKQCDSIHVQTQRMKRELEDMGLDQVHLLPNARRFPLDRPVSGPIGSPLRLVFLSRVTEAKGLDLAVDAVRTINEEAAEPQVTLTIYGQIQTGQEYWFATLQERFTSEITYAGSLRPDEINDHLIQHDVMLFPTWYSGEGFPGVLIDAMIAGIPVIASDWIDNAEYVREGDTGLLFEAKNMNALTAKILWMVHHPDEVMRMKHVSAGEAEKYHVDVIWPDLLNHIKI